MELQVGGVPRYQILTSGEVRTTGYAMMSNRFGFNNGSLATSWGYIMGSSNGILRLVDNTEANFNRLQFGGTTSSFPSLKRSGTAIDVRLADDSGWGGLNSAEHNITPPSLTGSSATSALSIAQTWNTTGSPTAIDLNVTNTASGVGSLLMNLRVGGSSQFSVGIFGAINIQGAITSPGLQGYRFQNQGTFTSPSDGVFLFRNSALNDFNRLQFGGTTSSFPSLKRSGTTLQVRLGDDTGFGGFTAANLNSASNLYLGNFQNSLKSNSSGVIQLQNTAENDFDRLQWGGATNLFPAIKRSATNLQVRLADDSGFTFIEDLYRRVGSGSPEGVVTAPIGAIYHRTDGGAGTSFYVKESGTGSTGWISK